MAQYKKKRPIGAKRHPGRKKRTATIKSLSRKASLARLSGNVEKARRLEQLCDINVREAERQGWGGEAEEAVMRGLDSGSALYRRKH